MSGPPNPRNEGKNTDNTQSNKEEDRSPKTLRSRAAKPIKRQKLVPENLTKITRKEEYIMFNMKIGA